MNDISVAERRLVSALDRLDHTVDRAARRMAAAAQPAPAPPTPAPPPEASGDVSLEIAALHDRQAATLEAMQMRLAEAHERLASAGEQAARLAAANDDLARANRALIEAADSGTGADQATLQALEAEVESLRAARAAEIAQMSEILDALDRMLGVTTTPRSHSTAGRSARARKPAAAPAAAPEPAPEPRPDLTVIRDEDPLPEDEPDEALLSTPDTLPEDTPASGAPLFGGVYDDDADTGSDDEEERR